MVTLSFSKILFVLVFLIHNLYYVYRYISPYLGVYQKLCVQKSKNEQYFRMEGVCSVCSFQKIVRVKIFIHLFAFKTLNLFAITKETQGLEAYTQWVHLLGAHHLKLLRTLINNYTINCIAIKNNVHKKVFSIHIKQHQFCVMSNFQCCPKKNKICLTF